MTKDIIERQADKRSPDWLTWVTTGIVVIGSDILGKAGMKDRYAFPISMYVAILTGYWLSRKISVPFWRFAFTALIIVLTLMMCAFILPEFLSKFTPPLAYASSALILAVISYFLPKFHAGKPWHYENGQPIGLSKWLPGALIFAAIVWGVAWLYFTFSGRA